MLHEFRAKERARISNRRSPPSYPAIPVRIDSEAKYWLEKVKQLPDIRQEKVRSIREAIQSGQYDLDSRLNDVLDRLPGKLGSLDAKDE